MAKLLPILLALVGLAIGTGAGFFLKPAPAPDMAGKHTQDGAHDTAHEGDHGDEKPKSDDGHAKDGDDHDASASGVDFVKLNNQFVVPVVENGRVKSLVVLSLSLEVEAGGSTTVYEMEPKLRDSFLRVLFDHANSGGFHGSFTDTSNVTLLRHALREAAQSVVGAVVMDVLIVDMMRQDS